MDLNNLTIAQKDAATRLMEYKRDNPEVSLLMCYKTLGINSSTAHSAAKRLGFKGTGDFLRSATGDNNPVERIKRTYKKRSKMQTLLIPPSDNKRTFIVVVPQGGLSSVLNELMEN